jgi:hypothetical protein
MTSHATTNSNAFRTERNIRNRSTKHVGGKAAHVAIKRERQQEKFGASKIRDRTISKAIKARQGKGWAIIQGDIHHPDPSHRMSWAKSWDLVASLWDHPDFQSTLATPSRDYFWDANPAQKRKAIQLYEEKIHMLTNAPH